MMSASKIAFDISGFLGEGRWATGENYTATDSWDRRYVAVGAAERSGGSYASSTGTVNPSSATGVSTAYLNWHTNTPGLDFGWPFMRQAMTISPLLEVTPGTRYTVSIAWDIEWNSYSNNPEKAWFAEPGTAWITRAGGSGSKGRTDTYSGVAGGTPILRDGHEYYAAPGFSLSGEISQNASWFGPNTYSGDLIFRATVTARIDQGDKPLVELDVPAEVARGEVVHLSATAWDPDNGPKTDGNGITHYSWEIISPSGQSLSREGSDLNSLDEAFAEVGLYDVRLTVFDDEGMSQSSNTSFTITGVRPEATIEGPLSAEIGVPIRLTAVAFDPDNPSGTLGIEKYRWNAVGATIVDNPDSISTLVTFARPGEHRITLTVTDDEGDTTVVDHTITVADFAIDFVSVDDSDPNNAKVTVDVSGKPSSLTWRLGNSVRQGSLTATSSGRYQFTIPSVGTLPIGRTHEIRVIAGTPDYTTSAAANVSISGIKRLVHRQSFLNFVPAEGIGLTAGPIRTTLTTTYTDINWSMPGQQYSRILRLFDLTVVTRIPEDFFTKSTAFGSVRFAQGTNSNGAVSNFTRKLDSIGQGGFFTAKLASTEFIVFSKPGATVIDLTAGGSTRTLEGLVPWLGGGTVSIRI